jgi:hypothetical protein
VQRPALDFGKDSGVFRFYCDACEQPIRTCCRSRDGGDYCSRACLERHDAERAKVKTAPLPIVKTGEPPKVKIPLSEKVKIRQASVPDTKVKIPSRAQRRIERRAAIGRIRREILKGTGREPTIAQVQSCLSPRGLGASVRTVWKDLNYFRAH